MAGQKLGFNEESFVLDLKNLKVQDFLSNEFYTTIRL
jgi:hypothetical protein